MLTDWIGKEKIGLKTNGYILFVGRLVPENCAHHLIKTYNLLNTKLKLVVVGGTHPALLEAMGMGNCIVVNDIPPNLETIGNAGLSYEGNKEHLDLVEKLDNLIRNPDIVEKYKKLAVERIKKLYSWKLVADKYEGLINEYY